MDNKISTQAKEELVRALGQRYRHSPKMAKTQILNEFIAVSGYHRKHAIRLLLSAAKNSPEYTLTKEVVRSYLFRSVRLSLYYSR